MANTNLTPDMITDEALRILHQKSNFIGNIITEYDDEFAKDGAKIGNTLRIRHPIQYSTGTGATMATTGNADTTQTQTTLTISSQRHVPMRFTSEELTLDIDDFSKRHIEPAMAVLAAKIEADAFGMIDLVASTVHAGTAISFAEVLGSRKKIVEGLAPVQDRSACLDSQANVDLVDALKGLFQDSGSVSKQYKEGMMGHTAGFDFYENTLLPKHTSGAEGGLGNYLVNNADASNTDASNLTEGTLVVDTGTKTIKLGDVFSIANVYDVHPETKESTGVLKQFAVRADAAGAGTLSITPTIITGGPYKNVNSTPANNAALTFVGAASTTYNQSLLFQKGFACIGFADLVLPKGTHMASRRNYDGVSMRLVSDYDIVKDRVLTRMDVLYGYKVLRPQLACKLLHT
jgi:hypothetical protein|tara:strand:- start:1163 stop:2374 length:1212 start_codon:yes stop_codon:yes gene_type:complete